MSCSLKLANLRRVTSRINSEGGIGVRNDLEHTELENLKKIHIRRWW